MLKKLRVSNLAVVEKAEADFVPGLNVLTGETGAGKSVLIGALELVLGGKAASGVVRDGASEAEVEAEFAPSADSVRRTVTAAGRSRAWVNDESVTLAELKTFFEGRVDIHGPRANQKILDGEFQREVLDSLGGVRRGGYDAAYRAYVAAKSAYEKLASEPGGEDELDMLRYQVDELEKAGISDDDETLAERHAALAHAGEIVEAANEITEALGGERGVAEILASLQPRFRAAARHFPAASEWAQSAEDITIAVQELSRTVADAVSAVEADPAQLEELDARLTLVNRLKRKYGDPRAKLAEKRERLDALEHREERLAELAAALSAAERTVREEGAKLTAARRKAAEKLAKAVTRELRDLCFRKAVFSVELSPMEPAPSGCDVVTYVFGPNPGEAARPLADIASSGEAARVMLAIKVALAEHDGTEILVFDEIDANIGGEAAAVVGAKLRALAKSHQVLAITHLPQSAAFGERHLVVRKEVNGGRTRTRIASVEGEDRVNEIARMLGGEHITSVVREHAKELLGLPG